MKIIIFAGGAGKRLWPVSRIKNPKQFQKIYGNETSLENSFNTIKNKFDIGDIFVSTGSDFVEDVLRTLPKLPPTNLILEPLSKDTGPAVAYAMLKIHQKFPNEPVVIRWQNSLIKNPKAFVEALTDAERLFKENVAQFVYLAVPSKFPNPNVGYIQAKFESVIESSGNQIRSFVRFTEKPDLLTAQEYQKDESYFWNPGCYITTPDFVIKSIEKYNQDLFKNFILPIQNSLGKEDEWDVTVEAFKAVKKESVDYALWEKLPPDGIKVIATDYDWHYVSTWSDIKAAFVSSEEQNYVSGNVVLLNTKNSLVANFSDSKIVAVSEVEDVVVVNTDDAVLVISKSKAGKVKEIVSELEKNGMDNFI
ncbi:hypothetical protein D6810_02835 [Candidatus Dojkabacteria bacterium]|uniref:Nucleotidyl transferase domain-containing protein n=1 Tax=Candidatus Dojkabacteria bacterium TaxID=2099670 RepID=A0A3M0Z1K2_9BACT|nr:MAG: hypothetical protein D6810_02835 [Candidatus Dojkabacteria bacterium]